VNYIEREVELLDHAAIEVVDELLEGELGVLRANSAERSLSGRFSSIAHGWGHVRIGPFTTPENGGSGLRRGGTRHRRCPGPRGGQRQRKKDTNVSMIGVRIAARAAVYSLGSGGGRQALFLRGISREGTARRLRVSRTTRGRRGVWTVRSRSEGIA
jgi:hypothetical protein